MSGNSRIWGLICLGGLAALSACQAPTKPVDPTTDVISLRDKDAFIDTALTVLREHDLQPQFADRGHGEIVTHPTTSAQWFEFWRKDAPGSYQLFESSIHTVQRVVTVHIAPEGDPPTTAPAAPAISAADANGDSYRLTVEVQKFRFSAPERQATTASSALAIYNERLPTREGLVAAKTAGQHWVPLGRDPLLETYLLEKLVDRAPRLTASEPPRPPDETAPPADADGDIDIPVPG
jgi:hypothetical protein